MGLHGDRGAFGFCAAAATFALAGCVHWPLEQAPRERLAAAVAAIEIPADAAVLAGAGDIAMCDELAPAKATGRLLDAIVAAAPDAAIFTTGDHAYPDGTAAQLARCYGPTWGRFNARTYPSPGNHDYDTRGAAPFYAYFDVFDTRPANGYYAFDLGAWRVIALNSVVPIERESAQVEWLESELRANSPDCILAFWHNPLFSSGFHGVSPWDDGRDTVVFWELLERHGVDVVVNGHDHLYERFAPQDADGHTAPGGIREFVVGTGGAGLHRIVRRKANSEFLDNDTFGVLLLVLRPTAYEWAFIGVDGVVHDRSDTPRGCSRVKRGPRE